MKILAVFKIKMQVFTLTLFKIATFKQIIMGLLPDAVSLTLSSSANSKKPFATKMLCYNSPHYTYGSTSPLKRVILAMSSFHSSFH